MKEGTMKQHAFFSRRLLFALALALCPLLACGSLSLAFAASVTITTTVGHDVHGNGKDTQGTPK